MERRQFPRVPLDDLYFVTVRFDDTTCLSAQLLDVGRGGLQLAFPPQHAVTEHLLGCKVFVDGLSSSPLEHTAGKDSKGPCGRISWVTRERCGVRFTVTIPLTDEEIETVARKL